MTTFFLLGKYSAEALRSISAERTAEAAQVVRAYGGEVKSMHALLGPYDLVLIVDLPGIEQAVQASVKLARLTGIAFVTAPALPVTAFDQLAGKL
jgi:uncharacterized protein with GYD domain